MPAHRTKEKKGIVATESRHTLEGRRQADRNGTKAQGMAGIECPDKGRRGGMGLEVAGKPRHTVEGMARDKRKKEKAPKEKKPPAKKEKTLLAAPLAYGRLRRILSCFSPPLASSYGGCAATLLAPLSCSFFLPSPRLSRFLWAARRLSSRASFGRLRRPLSSAFLAAALRAAAPSCPPISLRLKTPKNAVTSHEFFFFCHFFKRLRINIL